MQPQDITLERALELADHASPAPWIASQSLKAMRAEIERLLAEPGTGGSHPDDVAVDRFAAALKAKLAEARAKGRGGWQDRLDCPQHRLSDMLRDHVEKGDPRDVGAFCVFLQQRGEAILPALEVASAGSCIWSRDGDDSDTWNTGCRNVFLINDGAPNDNGMGFCCFCGKPVEQHLGEPEDAHHE